MTCKQVTKGLWWATSYIAPSNNKNKCNNITNLNNTINQNIANTIKDHFAAKQTWIVSQKQIRLMQTLDHSTIQLHAQKINTVYSSLM